jgi:hypothetical protein
VAPETRTFQALRMTNCRARRGACARARASLRQALRGLRIPPQQFVPLRLVPSALIWKDLLGLLVPPELADGGAIPGERATIPSKFRVGCGMLKPNVPVPATVVTTPSKTLSTRLEKVSVM